MTKPSRQWWANSTPPCTAEHATHTGVDEFYDQWTELFLRGFGPILQAGIVLTGEPAHEDPEASVLALAAHAEIGAGDRVLDAGCGVAGPAIVIAEHCEGVAIDGVTVSKHQAAIAQNRVRAAGLSRSVRVYVADYHALPFQSATFDQVLFLESTGYAVDLAAVYVEAFRVLKPNGRLYVKDVFCRAGPLAEREQQDMETFDQLWGCVRSKTMRESGTAIEAAGFEVRKLAPMIDVGTSRLLGSMYELDPLIGLRLSELGESFWRRSLNPPIEFGEINAVKPA